MASDALVALGVVATGGLLLVTRWLWLDPAISLAISAVIVWGTWSPALREALALALAGVPAGIDRGGVAAYLAALPGVTDVHDLHIWGMSTTETALTAHLVRPGAALDDALLTEVCAELKHRFAIEHATLQVECGEHPCEPRQPRSGLSVSRRDLNHLPRPRCARSRAPSLPPGEAMPPLSRREREGPIARAMGG